MNELSSWWDVLQWAQEHHYPQLVLDKKDVIPHGEQAWLHLAIDSEERFKKAAQRIQAWNERIAGKGN